ncbi:hypothetical protein PUNSTDRAFT_132256 [Punctularia strigosozonata HHB-11173 SS5]|uniref:uncharacterized protein n=1 Tax=Punctularia strigosozonata (strain HHB-11173) TaxID=741275 RepID=UPI0004417EA9|nr:uncharacterized protein PUNSTDRAFT_132256 [Punctularia strigosozonata HHB-11173 SS5]EIN10151.1 hypothetical protein PUNSTDRAFT_132256 [Punctularia strigosozonata HHB-11173 SS5]
MSYKGAGRGADECAVRPPRADKCMTHGAEPIQLTWSDGTAPYFLSLLPGGQPSATPLESFIRRLRPRSLGPSTSLTCTTAQIKDSTGTLAYSDIFTIQSGSDSSCLTSSGAAGAISSGSSATTSGAAATTTGTGSSGASTTAETSGSVAATGSSTASSSALSTSSSSNAARGSSFSAFGIAGVPLLPPASAPPFPAPTFCPAPSESRQRDLAWRCLQLLSER